MKILLFILLCGLALNGLAIVPGYYGARSLSLGYASTAFNYDINATFVNPALLSSIPYSLSGYQYQNSYLDYKTFAEDLNDVLAYNLENFEGIGENEKGAVISKLRDIFQAKAGMYGFRSNIPGYISRGYGFSISFVNTAIVNPIGPGSGDTAGDIFNKDIADITNEDIAALRMNFIGLNYKKMSLSYAMEVYRAVSVGIGLHYLNGKISDFSGSIAGDIFTAGAEPVDYLEYSWEEAKNNGSKFSRLVLDLGINVTLGRYFNVGLVYKNTGGAKIKAPARDIVLPKRIIAGIAFKPNNQWGFFLDMDVRKTDLLYNGQEQQPISFGIEKGLFKNKFFIRAGMLNDLTEKHFFGKKSNTLYGLGLGFNMGKIVVDAAVGIDSDGTVKNLAVSGFFIIK